MITQPNLKFRHPYLITSTSISTLMLWHYDIKTLLNGNASYRIAAIAIYFNRHKFIGTNSIAIKLIGDALMNNLNSFEMLIKKGIVMELYKRQIISEQEMRDTLEIMRKRSIKEYEKSSRLLPREYG